MATLSDSALTINTIGLLKWTLRIKGAITTCYKEWLKALFEFRKLTGKISR